MRERGPGTGSKDRLDTGTPAGGGTVRGGGGPGSRRWAQTTRAEGALGSSTRVPLGADTARTRTDTAWTRPPQTPPQSRPRAPERWRSRDWARLQEGPARACAAS